MDQDKAPVSWQEGLDSLFTPSVGSAARYQIRTSVSSRGVNVMVSGPTRFSIDEGFRQLAGMEGFGEIPQRQEFCDPLLVSFQEIPLSRLIDEELERFYNPSNGAVQMISRVFRRLTQS